MKRNFHVSPRTDADCSRSVYRCTSKYVGEYCQHLNPCHTGPRCQNGGSCRVKESSGGGTPSFACSCPVGFTASLCEIPIENACDSSPCLNGATCNLKSLREYVCTCATGYTGKDSFGDFTLCVNCSLSESHAEMVCRVDRGESSRRFVRADTFNSTDRSSR